MLANFNFVGASSVLFTLVNITVQMLQQMRCFCKFYKFFFCTTFKKINDKDWEKIPSNLAEKIPELFKEYQQKDFDMINLAIDNDVKHATGVTCAEIKAFAEGPLCTFVTVNFYSSSRISAPDNKKMVKFVVVLVLGSTVYGDTYYFIASGKMISDFCFEAQKKASENAISVMNSFALGQGWGPGTVRWEDGAKNNIANKWSKDEGSKKLVKDEITQKLRLAPNSISLKKIRIENEKYGSILFQIDKFSPLRCAVYKLLDTSGSLKNTKLGYFSVVLEYTPHKDPKLIYISDLTPLDSEAAREAEKFAAEYLIWETGENYHAQFDNLCRFNKSLYDLVAKTVIRKKILQTHLKNYTELDASFPEKLSYIVDRVLANDRTSIETELRENRITSDLVRSIINDASVHSNTRLHLTLQKFTNLATPTGNRALYWFEVKDTRNNTYQCVAISTVIIDPMISLNLEITDIFQGKEKFSVQTRQSMLETKLFTTNLIPLYWHLNMEKVVHPAYLKHVTDLFNDLYLPQIRRKMKEAKIKGDLSESLYDVISWTFASRLNSENGNTFKSGVYFEVQFSSEQSCYVFFVIQVNADGSLEFNLPIGSILYDTKDAVMDTMESILV